MPRYLTILGRVLVVVAVVILIFGREGVGPPYLDQFGKALFWSCGVFIPLIGFHYDLLGPISRKGIVAGLFTVHILLIRSFWQELASATIFLLAPICFVQLMVFAIPFLIIRREAQNHSHNS